MTTKQTHTAPHNNEDVTNADLARMFNDFATTVEQRFTHLEERLNTEISTLRNEINTRFDAVAVHMKKTEAEFAANRAAHERFEAHLAPK